MSSRVLSFDLGGESFGIRMDHLREVISLPDRLRTVPGTPDWIAGLTEVRGAIVTIIDPAPMFEKAWEEGEANAVILRPPRRTVGILLRGPVQILGALGDEPGDETQAGEKTGGRDDVGEIEPTDEELLEGIWKDEEMSVKLIDPELLVGACRDGIRRRSVL